MASSDEFAAARAAADQEFAHINNTLDQFESDVRDRLSRYPTVDAWSVLCVMMREQVGDRPDFLIEMLSAMAIRHVQAT